MSYLVLARQYRPQNFAEMVGQDHVVRALTNALQSQRLHHAYLFTGTRGVGKTTVSRIMAKSLNCVGADGQGGITDQPCGVCQACRDIDAGRFIDYVELDAASNRGVDEISQLLQQAVYKPVVGRFKVFMIDEVHMLSNTAFNAMLKTLEEPPEYLKFILATTDPQKVPVTVLSRCLQFNLRPMAPETIFEHLQQVLGKEKVAFDAGSLRMLSKSARGSMRDALSLADQAIAYGNGHIEEAAVRQMLGSIDQSHVYQLIESLAASNGKAVIELVDAMRVQGLSAAAALEEMANVLQRMAVLRVVPDAMLPDDPDDAQVATLAGLMGADEVQLLYSIVLHGQEELGLASDEYAALVMVLLRVMAFKPLGQIPDGKNTQPPVAHQAQSGTAQTAEKKTELNASTGASTGASLSASKSTPEKIKPLPTQALGQQADQNEQEPSVTAFASDSIAQKSTVTQSDDLPPWVSESIPDHEQVHVQNGVAIEPLPVHATQTDTPQTANTHLVADPPAQTMSPQSTQCIVLPEATTTSSRWEQVAAALIEQKLVIALARELVLNSQVENISADEQQWEFKCGRQTLIADANRQKVIDALQAYLGHPVRAEFHFAEVDNTPALRLQAELEKKQGQAEQAATTDPDVQKWLHEYPGARVIPGSIKAV